MYPFSGDKNFVTNAWYIAAWSEELADRPLGRKLFNLPVVLFRSETGTAAAIWGLCPHRHFPLSEGQIVGDSIICPYHGFRVNGQGYCTHVPAQKQLPSAPVSRTFPIIERDGIVWIWPGDRDRAGATQPPAMRDFGFGVPGWQFQPNGLTYVKARAQLVIDNLMDLSHVAYLHARSLSFTAAQEVRATYDRDMPFRAHRMLHDQSPDDAYQRHALPDNRIPVDLEISSTFLGPAVIITTQRISTAKSLGNPRYLGTVHHIHGPTPETATTTHDFSGFIRDCTFDSPELDGFLRHVIHAARVEDVFALERIEEEVDQWAEVTRELAGPGDLSVVRVRRCMQGLLDAD